MDPTTHQSSSLWTARGAPAYAPLTGDTTVDVAVVGAGIVGLTAASLLLASGRHVAVIESRSVGRQTTGGSSAKITAQHSLIYRRLAKNFDEDTARTYAEANSAAVEWLGNRITTLGIECSYERRPAYALTNDPKRIEEFEDEAALAASFGLPARFTTSVPLPLPAVGAVVFDGQAQFDPYAYVSAEAQRFVADGGLLYEDTRVTEIDSSGSPVRVVTERGTVTATDVVLATNLPIADAGLYFAKAVPIAHVVIAAPFEGEPPDGMFITADQPTHSMRWHRDADGRSWMIALGPRFRPGVEDTAAALADLEAWTRQHFSIGSVEYRWWNQDFESVDGIPYVGRQTSGAEHTFVATGFSSWGITNSVVAAQILADTIEGRPNAWAKTFDSTRTVPLRAVDDLVRENIPTAKAFVAGHLGTYPALDLSALDSGDGIVVDVDGQPTAVSRDAEGKVHAVSAKCTHLGCILGWNRGVGTWDCACHGSSFDPDGQVLRGPAVVNL